MPIWSILLEGGGRNCSTKSHLTPDQPFKMYNDKARFLAVLGACNFIATGPILMVFGSERHNSNALNRRTKLYGCGTLSGRSHHPTALPLQLGF